MNPFDIAQYIYVILLALMAGVVLAVVLLFLGKVLSGPKKKPPKQELRKCDGPRNGKTCGKKLYKCDNCQEVGCEMVKCDGQCFDRTNCLRCLAPNSRADHHELVNAQ